VKAQSETAEICFTTAEKLSDGGYRKIKEKMHVSCKGEQGRYKTVQLRWKKDT
jgi:hypothetical protein